MKVWKAVPETPCCGRGKRWQTLRSRSIIIIAVLCVVASRILSISSRFRFSGFLPLEAAGFVFFFLFMLNVVVVVGRWLLLASFVIIDILDLHGILYRNIPWLAACQPASCRLTTVL